MGRPDVERLGIEDFAKLFGVRTENFDAECRRLITEKDFRYWRLTGRERDDVLLRVFRRVEAGDLSVAGRDAKPRWERGWSENLEGLLNSNFDVAQLVPKYVRPNQSLRLYQDFIMPMDPRFELNWYSVFRRWLFSSYLRDVSSIYEVGCGSAYNLVVMAEMFPEKRLYGLDWTTASCDIVNKLAEVYGWKMQGRVFDVFSPDPELAIDDNAAIVTIGCLEQTGLDYVRFIEYLLERSPALVVHSEPILEWYDENNLVDYSAILVHRRRRFMEGLSALLKALETRGEIDILKMKRSYFGSLYMEGYSQLIWRPTKKGTELRRAGYSHRCAACGAVRAGCKDARGKGVGHR